MSNRLLLFLVFPVLFSRKLKKTIIHEKPDGNTTQTGVLKSRKIKIFGHQH